MVIITNDWCSKEADLIHILKFVNFRQFLAFSHGKCVDYAVQVT